MIVIRKDDVERVIISAHVDKRLVEYINEHRLGKSDCVERGLQIVLEHMMSEEDLVVKLANEAKQEREKISAAKRRLNEIDEKAVKLLGTTLDDYIEKHNPLSLGEREISSFLDWFRKGKSDEELHEIFSVSDTSLLNLGATVWDKRIAQFTTKDPGRFFLEVSRHYLGSDKNE